MPSHVDRDLFNLSPEAGLVTDWSGVVLHVNAAAGVLLDVEPRHLIGQPFSTIGREEEASALAAAMALLQDGSCIEAQVILAPRGNTQTRVELRGKPMKDPLFYVWTLRAS